MPIEPNASGRNIESVMVISVWRTCDIVSTLEESIDEYYWHGLGRYKMGTLDSSSHRRLQLLTVAKRRSRHRSLQYPQQIRLKMETKELHYFTTVVAHNGSSGYIVKGS